MKRPAASMQVGVIADTHGLLRPEALAALRGSERIIHAGDVGKPEIILPALAAIAPVIVVRGNVDREPAAAPWPEAVTLELAGVRIHLVHDVKTLAAGVLGEGVQVVISGHSHQPGIREQGGMLYLNPGAAGPRRFRLPISVAMLHLAGGVPTARIVMLDPA